jgi:hypothetical protein
MLYKKLFLLNCIVASSSLQAMVAQDLALLHAQLAALAQTVPQTATSTSTASTETKATNDFDQETDKLKQDILKILDTSKREEDRISLAGNWQYTGFIPQLIEHYWKAVAKSTDKETVSRIHKALNDIYNRPKNTNLWYNHKEPIMAAGFHNTEAEGPFLIRYNNMNHDKRLYEHELQSTRTPSIELQDKIEQHIKFLTPLTNSTFLASFGLLPSIKKSLKELHDLQDKLKATIEAKKQKETKTVAVELPPLDPETEKLKQEALKRIKNENFGGMDPYKLPNIITQLCIKYLEAVVDGQQIKMNQLYHTLHELAIVKAPNFIAQLARDQLLGSFTQTTINTEADTAILPKILEIIDPFMKIQDNPSFYQSYYGETVADAKKRYENFLNKIAGSDWLKNNFTNQIVERVKNLLTEVKKL